MVHPSDPPESSVRRPAVVVVAGGDDPDRSVVDRLPQPRTVIAADSGLDHAIRLGLDVDRVVGDMDSVDAALLAGLDARVVVERHPVDKDATDLELAIRAAIDLGVGHLVVVGGHGGRIDHLLANVGLLCHPDLAEVDVVWYAGRDVVVPVRDRVSLPGLPGAVVSLVPVGGPVSGVTTIGLAWELHDATLEPGSTRAISNRFTGTLATVTVGTGVLVVVVPAIA